MQNTWKYTGKLSGFHDSLMEIVSKPFLGELSKLLLVKVKIFSGIFLSEASQSQNKVLTKKCLNKESKSPCEKKI